MPKHELSDVQLKQWYQNFTKELYEKANIDVTRKEDLGRVKNFEIKTWKEDECTAPYVDCHYVYVPRNGSEYITPPPSTEEFDEYGKWLMDNLQTGEPGIEQIREMYHMSREGTLMALGPLGGIHTMMQIYTDEFGKIETSLPMTAYEKGDSGNLPENKKPPKEPVYVEEPDMMTFGFKTCPQAPEPPENMNPSFWSFLGHLLGFNTDYSKKKLYDALMESYPGKVAEWKEKAEELEPEMMHEFRLAEADRERFETDFRVFRETPLSKAIAIDFGYGFNCMRREGDEAEYFGRFLRNEEAFLKKQHAKTPQGVAHKARQETKREWDYADRNKRVVRNLVGPDPNGNDLVEWLEKGILTQDGYNPTIYELPAHPKGDAATEEEKMLNAKKMSALAEIAGFSAMADPKIAGEDYKEILKDLFTVGCEGTSKHFSKLETARALGMKALNEYHEGKPQALAELIANSIRQTNQIVTDLSELGEHELNTLYLVDRLMTALKENPDLRAASGLSDEELKQTAANVELYNVMRRGMEGKMNLLDHALYQKTLSPEQLRQASLDVMFAAYAEDKLVVPQKEGSVRDLLNQDWVTKQKENMLDCITKNKIDTMSREELGSVFSFNNQKVLDKLSRTGVSEPAVKKASPEPVMVVEAPDRQQNVPTA